MRRPDWPEQLAAAIAEARATPFAWGRNDCICWAFRVVHRLGGPELLGGCGTWHDERSAQRAIRRWGWPLDQAMRARCALAGMQPLPAPELAQRGDLVVLQLPDRQTAAICEGRNAWATGPEGVVALPMSTALAAWAY